jgi:phage shock protein A
MALMERVTTLLRANLNDLIDKAESPEKMLKQLVIDMENQLLQVKTQVAIAIADQHLLEKKTAEQESSAAGWKEKAQLAVARGRDDMAREALGRALTHTQMSRNFAEQLEDQRSEAEALRTAFHSLQQKLIETRAQCDLLVAESRRARTVSRSQQARTSTRVEKGTAAIGKYKARITAQQAANHANSELTAGNSLEDRFALLERDQQVEALLEQLKRKELPGGSARIHAGEATLPLPEKP